MDKSLKDTFPSLEGLSDDEAIPVVISHLEKMSDRDTPGILGGEARTVNQVIEQIRAKTPDGLKIIDLWRKAEKRMNEGPPKKEAEPSGFKYLLARIGATAKRVANIMIIK